MSGGGFHVHGPHDHELEHATQHAAEHHGIGGHSMTNQIALFTAVHPFVGASAFAHKGGLHTSALGRAGGATYEHVDPELVGNHTRVLVSDLGGKAGMAMKAKEFGVDLDDRAAAALSQNVAELEAQGFVFEAADASLELLMRRATGWEQQWFTVEGYRVTTYHREVGVETEATVKVFVDGERRIAVGEGNGPVNALDTALRRALIRFYPQVQEVLLLDYKVRVLGGAGGSASVVRVLIESADAHERWGTVGVSHNVIEASWQALVDSFEYKLYKDEKQAVAGKPAKAAPPKAAPAKAVPGKKAPAGKLRARS